MQCQDIQTYIPFPVKMVVVLPTRGRTAQNSPKAQQKITIAPT